MTDKPKPQTFRPGDAPAYPTGSDRSMDPRHWGMTKREHYAALICGGLMANPDYSEKSGYELIDWSIEYSDKLIERLAKVDREAE